MKAAAAEQFLPFQESSAGQNAPEVQPAFLKVNNLQPEPCKG